MTLKTLLMTHPRGPLGLSDFGREDMEDSDQAVLRALVPLSELGFLVSMSPSNCIDRKFVYSKERPRRRQDALQ